MTTPHHATARVPWAQTHTEADPRPLAQPEKQSDGEHQARAQTHTEADPLPLAQPETHSTSPETAPALNPPTWSGRKTAIAAALAIGFSSMGAVAAAATLPAGTTQGGGQLQQGGFGPGGRQQGGFSQQGSQQGPQQGNQLPGGQLPQAPGQSGAGTGQPAPTDPNASTT